MIIPIVKEKKIPTIYSDLTIRLVHLAKIKRLVSECSMLRNNYGYNKIKEDQMLISSLSVYKRSLKRRLRSKSKKDRREKLRILKKKLGDDGDKY